jgi:acyl-CoA thioester hydrolase
MSLRPPPGSLADYRYFTTITSRWFDNDLYGHVNNTLYYSYFDTVIAHLLMREGGLDPWLSPVVGMAVETGCCFHRSLKFPDTIVAGLRVARVGTSSVRYEIGLFRNEEDTASAEGHFVHVFVERHAQKPVPVPSPIRAALERYAKT